MSQPRRRRRRGRRGGQGGQGAASSSKQEAIRESAQGPVDAGRSQGGNRSRRRRGRGRSGGRQESSPKSSEDLVRALPRERPETLTAPPDGQVLEDIIGELQSTWGVPPYPQEYRITIKVAEERESRPESSDGDGGRPKSGGGERPERQRAPKAPARTEGGPRREKAPAAPGMAGSAGPQREKATRKKRRRRRRGGAGGGANPVEGGETPTNDNGHPPTEGGGGEHSPES